MSFLRALTLMAIAGSAGHAYGSAFGSQAYSNNFGQPGVNASYDYVVIGGGTAGLTIAARLAESGNYSVAVIEAGGFYEHENGNLTLVPGYYGSNIAGPLTNWGFETQPQPQLYNHTVPYARGKTLGGSSALNAMLYQIGTNESYQAWADAVGDEGWNFKNFLPYFQKSTNYTAPNTKLRAANASVPIPSTGAYTNSGGVLDITHPNTATPFSSWGQLALREIGLSDIEDFSSGQLIGSQYCPLTVRPIDQTRASSESSFLQSAFARNEVQPNLKVYIHTLAKQITFSSNRTANGVLVKSAGQTYMISAHKEVVLSAGAFQSPQLLMVSGVGPSAELEKHNITVVADRPGVGQNMWDHVLWPIVYEVTTPTVADLGNPSYARAAEAAYNQNQTGILTTNNADYLGWEKIPAAYRAKMSSQALADIDTFPADWPDLEFVVLAFSGTTYLPINVSLAAIAVGLITPLSRGNISLASANAEDLPLINAGWLSNETDIESGVAAVKRGRDFWATQALKSIIVGDEVLPGKNISGQADLREWVINHVQTIYHASCTCKMGKRSDPMAVIDSHARVIGVSKLRVVDASSFPILPPGHPQSTVYALAEKVAHLILSGH